MPIDLVNVPAGKNLAVRLPWAYAHATLQRLFRPADDFRSNFFASVPGILSFVENPEIPLPIEQDTATYLEHYLLRFPEGWVNILGGTKFGGWPVHLVSAMVPDTGWPHFPVFWNLIAQVVLPKLATLIPGSNNQPVLFSGHSLGGAVSVACCFHDFDRPTPRTRAAVTFGCPKARNRLGMDGRDFDHVRVCERWDPVPYLPANPLPTKILTAILKIFESWIGHHHYGEPIQLAAGHIEGTAGYEFPIWDCPTAIVQSTSAGLDPFYCHYMNAYACSLRRACETHGYPIEPWFDSVNAYLNRVEGHNWVIPGFPAQPPPPVPPEVTIPSTTVDVQEVVSAAPVLFDPQTTSLLVEQPLIPVVKGVSLASHLSSFAGRDIRDVTIRLSTIPIPDPSDVSLDSFQEATFPGYTVAGGPFWVRNVPPSYAQSPRFARRVSFACLGGGATEVIHYVYLVGHEGPTSERVLIGYQILNTPFIMDRPRVLAVDVEVSLGRP